MTSEFDISLRLTVSPAHVEIHPECTFVTTDYVVKSRLDNKANQVLFLAHLSNWFLEYADSVQDEKSEIIINLVEE